MAADVIGLCYHPLPGWGMFTCPRSDELSLADDQVADGLNKLAVATGQSGFDQNLIVVARCPIVGYVILKSTFEDRALMEIVRSLLGARTHYFQ